MPGGYRGDYGLTSGHDAVQVGGAGDDLDRPLGAKLPRLARGADGVPILAALQAPFDGDGLAVLHVDDGVFRLIAPKDDAEDVVNGLARLTVASLRLRTIQSTCPLSTGGKAWSVGA